MFSLFCYAINTALILFLFKSLRHITQTIESMQEFIVLKKSAFFISWGIILAFFSSLGLPPLLGFFNKFFIFGGLLENSFISLSLFLILFSVIPAIYYLRITVAILFQKKTLFMYFEDAKYCLTFNSSLLLISTVLFVFLPYNLLSQLPRG